MTTKKTQTKQNKREAKAAEKASAKKTKESKSTSKAKAKSPGKAEKPEKRTRKKKDADAPKKPMSAFFWYQGSRRENLKKEQPNLGHKEVIVVMSNEWK